MSTKSYAELVAEIEALKEQAEKQRKAEVSAIIQEIKEQIKTYALRPSDLFPASQLGTTAPSTDSVIKAAKPAKSPDDKIVAGVYRNPETDQRVTIGAKGQRPAWLKKLTKPERDALLIK